MKPIEELLKNLGRPEVLEFGLVTNRLPSVNIGGKFEPVDDEAPTTEVLMQMLVTMGGSRYVEQLSERPVQWTTRLDGVGVIAVAAIMRKEIVQARFTVARRDAAASAGAARAAPAAAAVNPLAQTVSAAPAEKPAPAAAQSAPQVRAAAGAQPEFRRTQQSAPPAAAKAAESSPVAKAAPVAQQAPKAAPAAQQAQKAPPPAPSPAPTATQSVPPKAGPLAGAVPPPDDWEDDDEPTVQTLSPPVNAAAANAAQHAQREQAAAAAAAAGGEPKPKPARKPGEVPPQSQGATAAQVAAAEERKISEERRVAEERAAAERKAAEDRKLADERAAAERKAAEAAAERKAAEDRKLADERKAAEERKISDERKAAEERAESDRKAQERAAAERAAAERAVAERAAQERAIAERQAADKRAAIERAAAERAATAERVAAERKASERKVAERRISTPTSVDAVDVEITTSDSGTRPAAGSDPDVVDQTVEMTPAKIIAARPVTGAMPSHAVPSAIPSTTPSAAGLPEKERPRADGALASFLGMATAARASDIHIVAGRPVLLRVATDLLPRTEPVLADHVERMARELVPSRLRELLEFDGSCDFAIEHPQHGRYRVNVSRQRTGYKLSLRVIPREIPTLATLALPDGVGAGAKYSQGLVLVTGPMSHGKTSTLAAIVDLMNRDSARHILMIEDPTEFVHPRKRALISQREVGAHARSLSAALEAAEREDPDVIVVGELRDAETVRMAVAASETGHLVLATMNTPTAAKTIDRLIEMFPVAEQPQIRASIAGALRLIIGQRLVPSADRTRLHAAVELLPSSIALYTLIRDARTFQIPSLQQRGRALGVVRLDESLAELVRSQKVTLEVAKQFAESPQELEAHATRSVPSAAARKV